MSSPRQTTPVHLFAREGGATAGTGMRTPWISASGVTVNGRHEDAARGHGSRIWHAGTADLVCIMGVAGLLARCCPTAEATASPQASVVSDPSPQAALQLRLAQRSTPAVLSRWARVPETPTSSFVGMGRVGLGRLPFRVTRRLVSLHLQSFVLASQPPPTPAPCS